MSVQKVTFQDGSELDVVSCGAADAVLSMEIAGVTVPEAIALATDPLKMGRIRCDYGGEVVSEYEGYTQLVYAVRSRHTGNVTVGLERERGRM